jgi:hypothetical protein
MWGSTVEYELLNVNDWRVNRMKTIMCLFTDIDKARLATETLLLEGFEFKQINVVVQESVAKNKLFISSQALKVEQNRSNYPLNGIERLLGGRQAFPSPDAGPLLCAGPEATTFVNAARYKSDLGLKFSLLGIQLPESIADYFRNGVKEGGLLFWIRVDDNKAGEVVKTMEYRNGLKIVSF